MRASILTAIALGLGLGASLAHADAGDAADVAGDGFCDYVEGRAAAESAVLFSPTVFGQFGLVEQAAGSVNPDVNSGGLRLITGVRVSLDGIYKGLATRDRARAECRRHQALEQVRGETTYQALDARAQVLDGALAEAEKILRQALSDLDARRTTAQEATATRLRVEELRRLAVATHGQLRVSPRPSAAPGGAVSRFHRADDDVERIEGKLRRASAFDVSLRVGLDQFLDRADANPSPYFAVVAVGVNLGALFMTKHNNRAAAGRRRLVRSGRDPQVGDGSAELLLAVVEAEAARVDDMSALEADLARQIKTLDRLGGEESRRYRQTVWFEWIKVKAEHAYLVAHVRALREVLGSGGP